MSQARETEQQEAGKQIPQGQYQGAPNKSKKRKK